MHKNVNSVLSQSNTDLMYISFNKGYMFWQYLALNCQHTSFSSISMYTLTSDVIYWIFVGWIPLSVQVIDVNEHLSRIKHHAGWNLKHFDKCITEIIFNKNLNSILHSFSLPFCIMFITCNIWNLPTYMHVTTVIMDYKCLGKNAFFTLSYFSLLFTVHVILCVFT